MALTDNYGNALSTGSDTARDMYVDGVYCVLGAAEGGVAAFEKSVEADPDFALAYSGLARAQMYAGNMPAAQAAQQQAEALIDHADAREKAHIRAFSTFLAGRAAEARDMFLAHVEDHPRDALAAQVCTSVFGLIGFSGKAAREAELLAYTSRLLPHYGDDWWMKSQHAISLCEVGRADESLALMEESLAQNPRNANGAHFKAHAQYEAGLADEGLAYLTDWMQDYSADALLHGHLSWHMSLWSLHAGDYDRMWASIDDAIGPGGSRGLPLIVLTDTAALLYRAELAGVEVAAERWKQISDYAAQYFPNPGQSFADMHAALAHALAGESDRLARIAESTNGFAGDLLPPISRAWAAIARGKWQDALEDLTPVMADHARLGGSRAQRDLLELTWVNLLLKLGRGDEARRTITMRRPVFAHSAPVAGYA